MQLKNLYLAIFIIGSVFSVLSVTSNFGIDSAVTVFFLTIAIVLFIQLLVELKYYRGYRAPLAAGIFLFIPSVLAIGASYVSRHPAINGQPFLNDFLVFINLNVSFLSVNPVLIYTNVFSAVFAPFYVIMLILLYRYYMGIYPRLFFLRKKFYKQFAMYYNIILMGIIGFIWLSTNSIEIFELVFVVISIILIIRTYVFKIVLVPVRVVPTRNRRAAPRRSYTSPNTTRNTNSNNTRSTTSTQTYQPQRTVRPARTPTPVHNRQTTPVRQTTQVRPTRTTTPPMGNIEVVDGITVGSSVKTANVSKVNKENMKSMIPNSQHLTQDDFRCIFCYELPTKGSDQVVICPNCKKPAHYPEYQKWTAYSNFCSYCNQDIGNRTPKRVNGKNYKNIISIALKNQ